MTSTNLIESLAAQLAHRAVEPDFLDVLNAVRADDTGRLSATWLDAELLDSDGNPSWVVTDLIDSMDVNDRGERDKNERASRMLLEAVVSEQYERAGRLLADALARCIAATVKRKADSLLFVESFTGPLKRALDHHDAIAADQRALAREHNRSL